jgi:hypothetical protein
LCILKQIIRILETLVEVRHGNAEEHTEAELPDVNSLFLDYDPNLQNRIATQRNQELRTAEQMILDELNIYDIFQSN